MKYLINENKLTETIETYILKNYPEVAKVYFTKQGVHLASGDFEKEEDRKIICTVINVVLDNMDGKYKAYQLREMSIQCLGYRPKNMVLNGILNLNN
jgi:hypothetical protein